MGGPGCAESICRRLVELLDLLVPHICSEAATALTNIVRKHPSLKTIVAPPLPRTLKYVTEPSGKASVIYLLGECGESIREAPYALEKLIDNYDDLGGCSSQVGALDVYSQVVFGASAGSAAHVGTTLGKGDGRCVVARFARSCPHLLSSSQGGRGGERRQDECQHYSKLLRRK